MICVGSHEEPIHLISHRHLVPPIPGVVKIEELIIGTVHHQFRKDQFVSMFERVHDTCQVIKLWMIQIRSHVELPVWLQGKSPSSIGPELVHQILLDV